MGKTHPDSYEARVAADLRELTERTRKLREELKGMVSSHPERDPLRRHTHAVPWADERRPEPQEPQRPERRRGGARKK